MNVVRFNCKQSSKNQCGSRLFSCRKNDLSRVSTCRGCRGIDCFNGIVDNEENASDYDFADYREGSRNFVTPGAGALYPVVTGWKPLTVVLKSYILDVARLLGLSLDYVTILFIGLAFV